MNNTRRKQIKRLGEELCRIVLNFIDIRSEEEEEDARDSIPESMWGTERYEKAEIACDCLAEAADSLEEILEKLEEAIEP